MATGQFHSDAPAVCGGSYPASRGVPQYFHLLWEEEVEQLGGVLRLLRAHEREVLRRWYELYCIHLGEARSFSEAEFADLHGGDFHRLTGSLLEQRIEDFVAGMRATGERLVDRGVPFREVIACLHLFEECCSDAIDAFGSECFGRPDSRARSALLLTLDKLSHCRLMIIADAYFEKSRARAVTHVRMLEKETARLAPDLRERRHFHGIVGQSSSMREVFQRIQAAAGSRGTVFIVGESGTGKELVARAIHELGGDRSAPFVPVNCSALPRELIESELFGYKRGAFSGAVTEYMGLFRAAQNGTIFLDEVTEMAPETQAKLLRVLQERTIRPVGSVREIPINVRITASTNCDLDEVSARGSLRRDLYYRLNVNAVRLPPLRDRMEDLPLLVDYFLDLLAERTGAPRRGLAPEVWEAFQEHKWPGNVRELMNVLESACTFGRGDAIGLGDVPAAVSHCPPGLVPPPRAPAGLPTFAEAERELITRALETTGGNKLRAAKLLGISRKKLYAKICRYQIESWSDESE